MLPLTQKIAFLVFAAIAVILGAIGFRGLWVRIRRGRADADSRGGRVWRRLRYAIATTITQRRTFRDRPAVSLFHSFIVYGFAFYVLLNFLDLLEGYLSFTIRSSSLPGAAYNLCADILSFLVVVGVIALVIRRFLLPSRRDFQFNARTPLHEKVRKGAITRDSVIVSAFILVHVGSRAIEQAAKLKLEGGDRFEPLASALSKLLPRSHAQGLAEFGYWGALGSVFAFLAYFPWSKHVHIFMAPVKYFFARAANSGELPPAEVNAVASSEEETREIGARRLEDLGWPRLLDAYACIQCNRCQDVCPASATGKALSPAALEINKRMELNALTGGLFAQSSTGFERGEASPRPLLAFALSPEALWACTTCGACMEVCPVENEQMLDIVDIRRYQVMMDGKFPAQLRTAFRGMERTSNPWGISRDQRFAWADGLAVRTIEENPNPEVLFWVGCAASYDPQAQRTARALVELLTLANVDFAVLGKNEACTGDSARRAGNEVLYRQLAEENIATLNRAQPKLIVATCPHCMNAIGNEYRQLGGDYQVMHHTEYLERLVTAGRLKVEPLAAKVAYHDPCYLGRLNGVYDPPRNVLRVLANEYVELERNRANSFCCGAGGAQFWKEEEPGRERISDNRYREAKQSLGSGSGAKVLAVGCPFCKNMLSGVRGGGAEEEVIEVKDVAELLLESVRGESIRRPEPLGAVAEKRGEPLMKEPIKEMSKEPTEAVSAHGETVPAPEAVPAANPDQLPHIAAPGIPAPRKPWKPKGG